MIDHTLLKPAAAVVLAGATAAALTVGQSAFATGRAAAAGRAAASRAAVSRAAVSRAAPAACTAPDPAIYTPPASVTGAPGTLLACEPVTLAEVPGNIPMTAWKVQYVSTDVHGAKIAVSGTVAVPTARWTGPGPRPVVAFNPARWAWAHSARSPGSSPAPSRTSTKATTSPRSCGRAGR